VRRPVLLLLLVALVAPGPAAGACDITQVETLDTLLPTAPAAVAAGRPLPLALRVTRAGQGAAGVNVFVALNGSSFHAYKSGLTGADGTARLVLDVPASARGPAELDVEAYRTLVELPCLTVEEYDRNAQPWGRVR
jgi:hypothetical protein